ncbi:substrate-binding domain-containing protein [Quadrisphaera oryzae]|uniref:substrate-binding domain-containing protein n=1 Tax=Quadrisphaera TaxID=317661 RepID=UPI0016493EC5|nr:sugar-binding protein [Quadrisphaera sp. RL12-1S]MBC3760626.1 sugar-binding protein [Quadrisphaera sp. RL12-1S]
MNIARRKFLTLGAVGAVGLALSVSGCSQRAGTDATATGSGSGAGAAAGGFAAGSLIGVSLPQKTSQNWEDAQRLFPEKLKAAGFESQVQFANSGVAEQQSQISALITRGAKALIIGPIDGSQLGSQLAQAKAAGIPVISYDRMITNSADVNYLVTFQPDKVGELQGQSLLQGLEAKAGHPAPYNVELFAGSPDDNNARIFFEGAMKVLQPKIDDGTLKVPSGQVSFQQAATQGWDPKTAQNRMDSILTANYSGATLDGVLSPNDTIARALITSITNAGKPVPPMTGQDSDPESIKLIKDGVQYSTIDKPTLSQVDASVEIVKQLAAGQKVSVTNGESDNGVTKIPTDFLDPTLVTSANLAEVYGKDPVRGPIATGQG